MRRVVLAAGVAAAISLAASEILTAQAIWREVQGEQFVLRARTDAVRIQELACDVQRAAAALDVGGVSPANIPSIVPVESERDARDLLPQFWEGRGVRPLGAYWSGPYGHHIVVRVDTSPRERVRRILHEYAHFATRLATPDPPRWLDEGVSEIWTHAAIEAGFVEIGQPVMRHLKVLRDAKEWIPIAELTSASELPPVRERARVRLFYAEAWLLAHFLAIEKGLDISGMNGTLASGDLPTDEQLQRYARGSRLESVRLPTGSGAEGCRHRPVQQLSQSETLLAKARMLADGERPDAALSPLRDALNSDPSNAGAQETLAFVHFRGNRPAEAAALFDQDIAGGSASFISYYYRAVLAAAVPQRSDGSGPVPAAEYFAQAARLNPGFAPAR